MCNPVRRLLPLSMAWVCLAATPALAQNDNNGFPPGTHYTLNIQGKTNCAGDDLTGSNRHTIQVLLNVSGDISKLVDKTNKIYLQPGRGSAVSAPNRCVQYLGGLRARAFQAAYQHEHYVLCRRCRSGRHSKHSRRYCGVLHGKSSRAHAQVGQTGDYQCH